MGEQGAALAVAIYRHPGLYSGKDCQLAKTPRKYRTTGLGLIEANHFGAELLDSPSYYSISSTNSEVAFADGASTSTIMVPTDNGELILIPAVYGDFVEVFCTAHTETLRPYLSIDHAIDLVAGYNLPYGWITICRSWVKWSWECCSIHAVAWNNITCLRGRSWIWIWTYRSDAIWMD